MAEHKCYSESRTKRISSWAKNSCWERLAHRGCEGISFQQHPHPQEKPVLHKRDWTVRCTWALPLGVFPTFPFCLHFSFSSFSPDTVFISRIRKNPAKPHHSLTPRPVALSTQVAYTTSNNSFNRPRAQISVTQYWISRHKYTSSLLTLNSLHIFFLRNANK